MSESLGSRHSDPPNDRGSLSFSRDGDGVAAGFLAEDILFFFNDFVRGFAFLLSALPSLRP